MTMTVNDAMRSIKWHTFRAGVKKRLRDLSRLAPVWSVVIFGHHAYPVGLLDRGIELADNDA